jgi:hypothetical protein
MKTKTILLAIAACAVIQGAVLADQPADQLRVSKALKSNANANAVAKAKPLVNTPLNKYLTPSNDKIQKAGNISSRAWTESVGWNPGKSAFATESTGPNDQGLTLLWIGHEP